VPDYVIVGAGSAGCVLAEALSSRNTVVVLEAGSDQLPREAAIPAAFSKLFKTPSDWDYATEPEPAASDRSLYLPRGKMIGGSSSMNAMLHIRGRPADYDGWEAGGATGWGWESVLPVFKAMEDNSRGEDDHHGVGGPVRVEDVREIRPLTRSFVEAAIAAGIRPNNDFNAGSQLGVGFFQVTQRRGRRWSAADAFLRPAMGRPTLEVRTEAHAARLLFDADRAVGVEYVQDGETRTVHAEAGVVVATGSYGSPHLLQLSGIGDPDHLESIGITTRVASPDVGQNLQDHPVPPIIYESRVADTLDDAENVWELARWLLFRKGRLASPVAEACAFVSSSPEREQPDLQFHFGPANFDDHGLEPYEGHAFTLGPVLVNPKSRGSVRAVSADPGTPPEIRVNCLSEQEDIDALISGVELAREIVGQPPLDVYRGKELKPGGAVVSRADVEEFVRQNVELLYHPVGTCRMGSDDRAVVDPSLRVNGVESLWVADASIMPTIPSGNTNAATLMISARAAELILAS
jgi:choline dehydrogenase